MVPASMRRQRGSAAVEFAMVGGVFFTVLTAVVNFGVLMAAAEAAADATRAGARIAAVCDLNTQTIASAVQARLPQLAVTPQQVSIAYLPAGCTRDTCQRVSVALTGVTYPTWIAFLPANLPLPAFRASLPTESLESQSAGGQPNPVCST
jgi:Flp pilus assembly protein TadG